MARTSKARPSLTDISRVRQVVRPVDDRLVHEVDVDLIDSDPRNARKKLSGIDELAGSLRDRGLLQPVVLRPRGARFSLTAGHRRLAAVRLNGWPRVRAFIKDEGEEDAEISGLVENLQRENLSPRDEAAALERLVRERGWSTADVAQAINRGKMYVSRRLRVFEDPVLAPLVLADRLSVSTAEELLVVPTADRAGLAERAAAEAWTRPQVRSAISGASSDVAARSKRLVQLLKEVEALADGELDQRAQRALARFRSNG